MKRRFAAESRVVAYTTDLNWRTEWAVYDRDTGYDIARRCRSRAAARWIAKALNENLEVAE